MASEIGCVCWFDRPVSDFALFSGIPAGNNGWTRIAGKPVRIVRHHFISKERSKKHEAGNEKQKIGYQVPKIRHPASIRLAVPRSSLPAAGREYAYCTDP